MVKTVYEEYVAAKDINQSADSDSVKSYLADMGNIELLSFSDEKRLSERILRGKCVKELGSFAKELTSSEIEEKGAGFFLEKAHSLLCSITELSARRDEYAVCNQIIDNLSYGKDLALETLAAELTESEIRHLKKLCGLKNIELPKFAAAQNFSSDRTSLIELYSIVLALKILDMEKRLYNPESLALKEIEKEFRRAFKRIEQQAEDARHELARRNLRLVISIAKKYSSRKLGLNDLIQEGNVGLLIAVDKYDYEKGYRFSTYATYWIRQSVTRAIADNDRTVRVPVHMADKVKKYARAYTFLLQKLGREPDTGELAEKLEVTESEIEEIQMAAADTVSLDEPVGDDSSSVLGDFIEDKVNSYANTEKSCDSVIIKEKMEEALNSLPDREQAVLRLRFGFKDGICHTLDEIGKMFGVTRERIRQIEEQALKKLNRPNRARYLDGFLACF